MSRVSIFSLVVIGFVGYAAPECNKCGDKSLAKCTDDRSFTLCENNQETTSTGKCPGGTVCANVAGVCTSTANAEAECPNLCAMCHETRGYACTSKTDFALCFEPNVVSNITGSCPANTVCSITAATATSRCVPNTQLPSCGRTTPVPPTPTPSPTSSPTTPTQVCEQKGTVGRFPLPGSQCRKYVYCYVFGDVLYGTEYTCPLFQLFNPVPQICVLPGLYSCPS